MDLSNICETNASINKLVKKYGYKFVTIKRFVGIVKDGSPRNSTEEFVSMNEADENNFSPVLAMPYKYSTKFETTLNFYHWIKELVENNKIVTK